MHDLPQANIVNPAVPIDCDLFIGIPVIGSTHINAFSTGFALNDVLVSKATDSLRFELDGALSNFKSNELIVTETHLSLFSAGYRYRHYYFTFGINEKINTYSTLNKNALLLINGGNSQFEGERVNMKGTRANAIHYREYALGLAKRMDEKLSVGFRLKLLFGKSNVYSEPIQLSLYTDPATFDTYVSGSVDIYSTLPINITKDSESKLVEAEFQENIRISNYLMNRSNKGFGFDFGFIYNLNESTTLSGSVLDIGYINWGVDSYHVHSSGSMYITGEAIDEGLGNLGAITDSLESVFTPRVAEESYLSPLVPAMYLGVMHDVNSWFNVGAVFHTELFRSKLHPSLTFSGNAYLTKNIYGSASYTLQNGEFNNVGAGIGAKVGIFHLHAVSDNIPAFFDLLDAKNVNLRFGVSMLLGCGKKKVKKKKSRDDKGIRAIPCFNDPYAKRKTRPKVKKKKR